VKTRKNMSVIGGPDGRGLEPDEALAPTVGPHPQRTLSSTAVL